ncbi:MAG TPA: glycosyltransferase family 39 protein [Bauldia sp.]|nr:glycosyltransferase family 39 protein [Bauldia sp.]
MTAVPVDGTARTGVAARLIAFLTVYFVLQAVLRLLAVSSLGLDDAEMVVITQALAPGYGSQPPLYNWLQIGAFAVLGFGAPAIVVLHFVLLWAVYVLVFLSARIVLDDEVKAAGVSLALFAIPQIGWEALHSHTHTLLSLTLAAATLLAMLRVLADGRWLDYLVLGVCFALGTLAKYSYVPFAAALVIAAATVPGLRQRIFSPRMVAAIVLALILLAPHLDWVSAHMSETLSRTSKFGIDGDAGLAAAWLRGLAAMAIGVLGYVALSLAVFAAATFLPLRGGGRSGAPERASSGLPNGRTFVLRVLMVALALVLIAVLATRATEVKERWLQPVLFLLPLALMIIAEPRLDRVRERLLIALSAGIGAMFMVALSVAYFFPDLHGGPLRASAPFGALAHDIRKLGFEKGYVLAENHYIAGNLLLHLQGMTVAEPEYGLWPLAEGGSREPVLLVWSGRRDRPPKALRALFGELCGRDALGEPEPVRLSAPYEHATKRHYELKVAVVQDCPAGP